MNDGVERLNAALEGRYRIERELGQGGMATVYLAEDARHDRKVALKVLKPELAAVVGGERFLAEIKTTAQLQHPNILPLFDSGEADSFLFYVMPYVEGETLRDRIEREGELPVGEAVSIAVDVAGALDHAHRHGVIHRDVKPANILLQDGRPLVADFGIALAVSAAGGGRLTETGLSLGTPHYMSPEQATADRAPGPPSDVYSLACVLYEMLTGRTPFPGSSAQAILGQIITAEPDPPAQHRKTIPPNVNGAVVRGLEKRPADRFQSAAELAEALRDPAYRYWAAAPGDAASSGLWKAIALASVAVAAAAIVLAGWGWLRPAAPDPVTRYRLALPEDQNPSVAAGVAVGRFALSSDGRKLAYVGGAIDLSEIWLLDRSELEATPVRTGDVIGDAYSPFFSPDGDGLGYLTDGGGLSVLSLAGGAPRTLVDRGSELGGAHWGTDGYIYFDLLPTPDRPNGIGRVPENGGDIEVVTAPDTTAGELNHIWPQLLPGARTLVYVALVGDGSRIMARDLETGETTEVTRGVRAQYLDPGYLIWVRADGALVAGRFDPRERTLREAPVALVDGIAVAGASAAFAASPSGTLLYARGTGGAVGSPTWVARDGTARPVQQGWEVLINNFFQSVALSPDDTRLVLSIQGPTLDLWVKELDTGPLSRLTFAGPTNFRARWFPDGRRVLFGSDRRTGQELWTKPTDGTGAAAVVPGTVRSNQADIAPDGDRIAYRLGRDLFARSLEDGDADSLVLVATEFDELAPAISPDGRWLAYVSNETGRDEIYVRPFPDASTGRWQISTSGGTEPLWSRDGRELYYRDADLDMIAVAIVPGEAFAAGAQQTLFSTEDYWSNRFQQVYDVSSDGRFILLRRAGVSRQEEVVIVENFHRVLEERLDD